MWECPNRGRFLKVKNQNHYYKEIPKTIDEYIDKQPEYTKSYLKQINETIKATLPDAKEKISWSMPTYRKQHNTIQFDAFKKHNGLYLGAQAVEAFKSRLDEDKTSKGIIKVSYDRPLPLDLIKEIAIWRERENSE